MSTPAPSRRSFLTSSLLGLGALGALPNVSPASSKAGFLTEPERDIPLNADCDVIVCGAGPAGVTAAIAAARAGAKVRLFEAHGQLGGVWTSSLLGYLLDFNKPGFNQELVRRLRERDAIVGSGFDSVTYHPEEMKLILEELCVAAGVKVQLHTRIVSAHRNGRRLAAIVTESKSGRQAWAAPVFIDATGDGDLGARAGCEFEIGREKSCPCQPMTLYALVTVDNARALADQLHPAPQNQAKFKAALAAAGISPSYGSATLFPIKDNLILLMANHEYGINATDAAQITEATMRARGEVNDIVRKLRKSGGAWSGAQIVATPAQIGVRDGRRIKGRYVMTKEDLIAGGRQDDSVVRATYPVDIHALTASENKTSAYSDAGIKVKPYDIPLRALIARDVDGLMMAGRCISGDFIAHASYRVTGNAVAMGEAAGVTSALAAASKRAPHEVSWANAAALLPKVRQV